MNPDPALEAVGLWKRYGDRVAVGGVDLVVSPGEIRGLLGPNGAGKTTLLRMILGLVEPDAGSVRLLGRPAGSVGIGVPPGVAGFVDAPSFYPYLSGTRNLELMARLDGPSPAARVEDRVAAAVARVGLTRAGGDKVATYSAGMRQRLGVAAALLRSPRLLVLDEPTSSLDPAGAKDLRELVARLADDGVAVVWSTHDMTEVEDLCSELTILHRGRVAFSGEVADLRAEVAPAARRLRTSDDARAVVLGGGMGDLDVTARDGGDGLDVRGSEAVVDRYVLELGRAGVAVRSLAEQVASVESAFLRLTSGDGVPATGASVASARRRRPPSPPLRVRGVGAVVAVECAKLAARVEVWAVLAACAAGPFAFVLAMRVQTSLPEDTLFGRWVRTSGLAVPLVVLGFAAAWAFPALTSVVSGDLFAAEDRHGTWATLLTRARTRREVFAGKALTGLLFSLTSVSLLATASLAAGALGVGRQRLIGLSGNLLPAGHAAALVVLAWASVLPPVFGFTALAMLISVATRSSAAGVGLPVVIGLVMELYAYVDGPEIARRALLTPPLGAWHGLFADPPYYGPLARGALVSALYLGAGLGAARAIFQKRDLGG